RDANNIAAASNVSWVSVTHGTPVLGAGGVMSITVAISIKGTYPQVMDYLGRLAGLQRLVVVDGVQLNPNATTPAATGTGAGGAGAGATTGGSTGPFSGGSQLTATISARMFETPPPTLAGVGTATATGATTAAATTKAAA
ncbi:MAG TPA: GspMb/PilO family protein, partial [Acidimicrobiia bacterium]|nr:GspMb/PilO family protein [Acidimicrobiia bacterium]